jgi:hypothetical protein
MLILTWSSGWRKSYTASNSCASEFLNRWNLAYKDRATSIISVSNFMS